MTDDPKSQISFLRGLKAIREYTAEPLAEEVLNDILDVGHWSASAKNTQPTEVVIVRDPAGRQKIAELGIKPAAQAAMAVVVITPGDKSRLELEAFDEGRLVERLLLAARAHGLGGNVGLFRCANSDAIKEALGIPAERRVWTAVTIGHVDHKAHNAHIARIRGVGPDAVPSGDLPLWEAAGRKPISDFAHWERY